MNSIIELDLKERLLANQRALTRALARLRKINSSTVTDLELDLIRCELEEAVPEHLTPREILNFAWELTYPIPENATVPEGTPWLRQGPGYMLRVFDFELTPEYRKRFIYAEFRTLVPLPEEGATK